MSTSPRLSIDVRSYGAAHSAHRHDFAQLVLPLSGALEIDIAGKGGRLGPCRAAFVEAGSSHTQTSDGPNRLLILDLDPALLEPAVGDRLIRHPFVALTSVAGKLIDYMGLMLDSRGVSADNLRLWVPLLLDALAEEPARPRSRLGTLLAAVEPDLAKPWTAETMAERACVSVSRLHALFRAELDTTPRAWLAEVRLKRACGWLARSELPIAEIAYRTGYADQSAFTRAMRRATGLTPAAYRRQSRETRHKSP
ncbi:helix-turn-helix domain-containing protein [Azospirillum brasilense]|uniref:helix-turn-helix transcriptional regulator n=1 Tax=Azospirillum argentinense TaxID=2970906 RepID=UPI00190E8E24|nr:AraC family transcriptional regulator [Azospirillum argentinense]MBK3801630.1 helix-turn-helix domain-containing protein [Azospirillum argentinense]